MNAAQFLLRADVLETRLCVVANRAARVRALLQTMRLVSRLGDGIFWYALILAMPILLGRRGVGAALHMALVGSLALVIYRQLKHRLVRERPFVRLAGIECLMRPLDRYSFPSGHTLHAVAFTVVACGYLPILAIVLVPFASAVAASRVILGLHYPTDVLAGALLGLGLARLSQWMIA